MTDNEYLRWITHHCQLFPDFGDWWAGLPFDTRQTIGSQWRQILALRMLSDCIEASNRMLAGTIDPCPPWERSMLASRIRTAAGDIGFERRSKRKEPEYETPRPGDPYPAGRIYAAMCRAVDAGDDPITIGKQMMAEHLRKTREAF